MAAFALAAGAVSANMPLNEILSAQVRYGAGVNVDNGLVEFVNDKELPVQLIVSNNAPVGSEDSSVMIGALGGAFFEVDKKSGAPSSKVYTNMTVAQVGPVTVGAGETKEIDHKLRVALPPNVYGMALTLYVQHQDEVFTVQLAKDKVSVEDEPISMWDPRLIIVQTILGATMLVGGYLLSKTYVIPLLDGKKSTGADESQSRRKVKAKSPVREKSPESGSDSPYDEQWIPEHHLRPRKAHNKKK